MAGIADKVFSLVKEPVEDCGVSLWDVRFLKEGAEYYLRIFIDKDGGVSIDDCTRVSHKIDPIIDEADPIDKSYYLEVCSAGLSRELTRDGHFTHYIGKTVKIKLYKAVDGIKQFEGILKDFDGENLTLAVSGKDLKFSRSDISKAVYEEI